MAQPSKKKATAKVAKVMKEYKSGTLHSGKGGPVVKSRKQAIAIAMSEAKMKKSAPKSKAHSPKGEYKSAAAKKKHEAKESPRKKAMEKKMGRSS